jgi:hypothetical protein
VLDERHARLLELGCKPWEEVVGVYDESVVREAKGCARW